MKLLRPHDHVDMRQFCQQGLAARLSHASQETEDHMRPFFRQAAQHSHFSQRFLISHVAYAACIQQHDISFLLVRNAFIATRDE